MLISMATIAVPIKQIFVNQKTTMTFLSIAFACVVVCESASSRNRRQDSGRILFPDDESLVRDPAGSSALTRRVDAMDEIFIEDLAEDEDVDYDDPLIEISAFSLGASHHCAQGYARSRNSHQCYKRVTLSPGQKNRRKRFQQQRKTNRAV